MAEYWVYENRTVRRARLHRAACGFCNNGAGFRAPDSGTNGCWHGPFRDKDTALAALERTGQADRGPCAACAP